MEKDDAHWLKSAGIVLDNPQGITAHVRPHDISVEKQINGSGSAIVLKDWQHLGATIRLELVKDGANGTGKTIYAEMPNDKFKNSALARGDKVSLFIKHAHWFT